MQCSLQFSSIKQIKTHVLIMQVGSRHNISCPNPTTCVWAHCGAPVDNSTFVVNIKAQKCYYFNLQLLFRHFLGYAHSFPNWKSFFTTFGVVILGKFSPHLAGFTVFREAGVLFV